MDGNECYRVTLLAGGDGHRPACRSRSAREIGICSGDFVEWLMREGARGAGMCPGDRLLFAVPGPGRYNAVTGHSPEQYIACLRGAPKAGPDRGARMPSVNRAPRRLPKPPWDVVTPRNPHTTGHQLVRRKQKRPGVTGSLGLRVEMNGIERRPPECHSGALQMS